MLPKGLGLLTQNKKEEMPMKRMNNKGAITIGISLVVAAAVIIGVSVFVYSTFYNIDKVQQIVTPQVIVTPPSDTVQHPDFDIVPTAQTTGYNPFNALNSEKTRFTVPAWSNQTGHTIVEIDNSTWEDPRMEFVVTPIPFGGADADDLATIYFEVSNYDARIETSSDTYRLLVKDGGNYQVNWSDAGTGTPDLYIEGTSTMLMTGTVTLYLDFDVTGSSFSRMDDNDGIDMTITFHNADWTWSETYTVTFVSQFSWGA